MGGWVGVITRIKANLSSAELGWTSQLELSLAKILNWNLLLTCSVSVRSPGINDLSGEWYKTQPIYILRKVANLLLFSGSGFISEKGKLILYLKWWNTERKLSFLKCGFEHRFCFICGFVLHPQQIFFPAKKHYIDLLKLDILSSFFLCFGFVPEPIEHHNTKKYSFLLH